MKTIYFLFVAGLLATTPLHAQSVCVPGAGAYGCPVAYPMPVIYQAAVAYMAPVIYQAPVYYFSPVAATPVRDCQPVSTVIYIGGRYSHTRNFYASCNSGTQVIYFGGR
jgi:hypothetical protein